jgi:hypothetical protein
MGCFGRISKANFIRWQIRAALSGAKGQNSRLKSLISKLNAHVPTVVVNIFYQKSLKRKRSNSVTLQSDPAPLGRIQHQKHPIPRSLPQTEVIQTHPKRRAVQGATEKILRSDAPKNLFDL